MFDFVWNSIKTYLKRVFRDWDDWVGDRDMEVAIRQHLSLRGFASRSAKLSRIRLVSVKPPGWLQVYQFDVDTKRRDASQQDPTTTDKVKLFGLVRLDARSQRPPRIESFEDAVARDDTLRAWKEGHAKQN